MKFVSKIRFEDNFEGNYFGSGDLTLSGTFKGTIKIDEGGYLNSSKVIKMSDQKTLKSKVLKS